jgi:hypothetical protein
LYRSAALSCARHRAPAAVTYRRTPSQWRPRAARRLVTRAPSLSQPASAPELASNRSPPPSPSLPPQPGAVHTSALPQLRPSVAAVGAAARARARSRARNPTLVGPRLPPTPPPPPALRAPSALSPLVEAADAVAEARAARARAAWPSSVALSASIRASVLPRCRWTSSSNRRAFVGGVVLAGDKRSRGAWRGLRLVMTLHTHTHTHTPPWEQLWVAPH